MKRKDPTAGVITHSVLIVDDEAHIRLMPLTKAAAHSIPPEGLLGVTEFLTLARVGFLPRFGCSDHTIASPTLTRRRRASSCLPGDVVKTTTWAPSACTPGSATSARGGSARPRRVPSSPYPISPPWISRAYCGETVLTSSANRMPPFM